jgi:hypothetical protein
MVGISRLKAKERDRLSKLIAMLGSDSAGERANAAALATALLQRHKLSWPDLLDGDRGRASDAGAVTVAFETGFRAGHAQGFAEGLTAARAQAEPPAMPRRTLDDTDRALIGMLAAQLEEGLLNLNPWETNFLRAIADKVANGAEQLSGKQYAIVMRIRRKAGS